MFWRCFLVGGIFFQLLVKARPSSALRKVELSDVKAVCNDNSRAVFYIKHGSPKQWIFFFESGGLCSSKAECNEKYKDKNSSVLMSSNSLPKSVIGRDILSSSISENPTFYKYTHVLVPYCSSDLWLGDSTGLNRTFKFVDDSSANNFIFRGKTIFRGIFNQLNLTNAEDILVSGSSAGGIGVMNHAEWLSNLFHGSEVKLRFIIDSAWFINFQDGFTSRVNMKFAQLTGTSSSACADSSYGYPCCLSSACLITRGYFPSNLSVAFVFSLYDIYMFADVLKRLESEGKTVEDHDADFLSVVSMYGGAMNDSIELPQNTGGHSSFFVPACFQHTYFSTSSLWDTDGVLHPLVEVTRGSGKFSHTIKNGTWSLTKISNQYVKDYSIQDFISSWVSSHNATYKLIDNCIGAHCNPTCPDKIVFLDAGEVWTKVIKTVVIGLSLVITVICSGLKLTFMCYYSYLVKRQENYLTDSETCEARKELPLGKSDETVSIACLFLSYKVDLTVQKKKSKNDNKTDANGNKWKLTCPESALDEDSGSYLQDSDESKEEERDFAIPLPSKLFNDIDDADSFNSPREQPSDSFSTMDGTSTMGSHAGSDLALLGGSHSNTDDVSVSFLASGGKDATDCIEAIGSPPTKQILKGVSAYFNTGELVAIMGPSGSGKTTLLDLLTGRRRHGHIEGRVYINGVGLGQVKDWYACKIGYVLQLAVPYYEELTVRQNLFFAAHMRLPKGTCISDKYERVEQIIAETGLTDMADTVVGGSVGLGLSGGQKRRLCVALQLINMPSVLFLDEPTSGLDASSSLELLNHLNLVAESGRLVILTIHQPRLEIFHLFHKILFLCDGQVAYYGEPSMAPEIFLKAYAGATTEEFRMSEDAPKIDAKNPADTIMDLLNCPEARHAILDYYQTSGEPQAVQEAIMTSQESAGKTVSMDTMTKFVEGAGTFKRIFVLEGRTSVRQTIGQLLYFPMIFFTFGIIIGTVYWQAEERDGILLMSAYCVYCCASPLFLSSVLMAHLNKALDIFRLERADGCGRSHENVIQTFVRTTAVCVLPVILCSTMSYFMVMTSYELWRFLLITILSLVLNQTWIAVYMMVICAQPQIAHRICPMVSAIGGFAGGFLVPRPQMPVVYNLLFYINPQFYGYAAITKVLLQNVRLKCDYESTLNCISTDGNAILGRFGLESVNPYEYLVGIIWFVFFFPLIFVFPSYLAGYSAVTLNTIRHFQVSPGLCFKTRIMLGMTVSSLLLAWLFLEAKYFTLPCFNKTPAAFLGEAEEGKVEVLVKQRDDISSGDDLDEFQLKTPKTCGIDPRSPSRRSAKSRLGLISVNRGFHSVKLPPPRQGPSSPGMFFDGQEAMDAGDGQDDVFARRRDRMTSVSGQALWAHTRQHVEERRISLDKRLSKVQSLARQYTIKHSQSVRRRAKERAAIPRRTTMASSTFSEAARQELSLKRMENFQDGRSKAVIDKEQEKSSSTDGNGFKKYVDIFDEGMAPGRSSDTKQQLRDDEKERRNEVNLEEKDAEAAESRRVERSSIMSLRKTSEGNLEMISESNDSSEGGEEESKLSKHDQPQAMEHNSKDKRQGSSTDKDARSPEVKKPAERRSVKRVSIVEFTDTLDV